MEQEFVETRESYESYVMNVFRGKVWGDDLIAVVFRDMWNIAITIISPGFMKLQPLFHNKLKPDVVIVANSTCWRNGDNSCTHFSATTSYDPAYKVPGTEYTNPAIAVDKVPNTDPIILSDKNKAKQLAIKEYLKDSEEMSLKLLQGVCVSINRLNNKIMDLIEQVDSFEEEKRKLEFRLQRLGVAADKIVEAGKIDEREYCHVGECEKRDRADAKRKREEEEAKEQENTKRQRVIPTVKGKYRKSYEIEGVEYEEEEEVMEFEKERHMRILTEQQKAIIENQAQLLQDQQKELDLQGSKIKKTD